MSFVNFPKAKAIIILKTNSKWGVNIFNTGISIFAISIVLTGSIFISPFYVKGEQPPFSLCYK